ncbi:MAG: glutamate racemase [Pseudomonadota bacterium]
MPAERFIYLGDTARLPYGTKGAATITRYSSECAGFLLRHRIKALVIACNTASSLALPTLQGELPCDVIGTIEPAVTAAVASTKRRGIGVIGTDATIASGAYERSIKALDPAVEVFSVSCPLFVPLVEQGMFEGEIVEKVVELYLGKFDLSRIDTLVLGCTHYPLLKGVIQRYVGSGITLVDSAYPIAQELGRILDERGLRASTSAEQGGASFYVTDEVSRFNRLAAILLGKERVTAICTAELAAEGATIEPPPLAVAIQ